MKLYRKIDNEGFFIEDIILEETPYIYIKEIEEVIIDDIPSYIEAEKRILDPQYVETPCPGGFYRPKWNGAEWIEGLTLEEIEAIKNQPKELTEIEKLIQRQDTTENAILFLMDIGGMM